MGTPFMDAPAANVPSGGIITRFYTSATWIDGRAEEQLSQLSAWAGVQQIAAFPDLHPGKYGPVGCAVLADRIYPQLIGNDIGCGMALFRLDLPLRKVKIEKAARRLRVLGEPVQGGQDAVLAENDMPENLFPEALGTIGGGNHFCEVQQLAKGAADCGFDASVAYLLVHSGSRAVGAATFASLPPEAFNGMQGDAAAHYREAHDQAVRWAVLNRFVIAQRAAAALRADLELVVDTPHNVLSETAAGWLHRKGAAEATAGLVPLAGSRASPSYLLRPTGLKNTLGSLAHGAGRRYDRASMHGRVRDKKSDLTAMTRTTFGGRVICEDRDLLIEEAPQAYKSGQAVVADLVATGAATLAATFNPLVTFKKTRKEVRV